MILDTCALLWLASGDKKLKNSTLKQIREARSVFVSTISAFEIALKASRGKLELPDPALEWFGKVVEHHRISVVDLDIQCCAAAAQLPKFHDDPCDRFIIAAAKLNKWRVVTADERFAQYGVEVLT